MRRPAWNFKQHECTHTGDILICVCVCVCAIIVETTTYNDNAILCNKRFHSFEIAIGMRAVKQTVFCEVVKCNYGRAI